MMSHRVGRRMLHLRCHVSSSIQLRARGGRQFVMIRPSEALLAARLPVSRSITGFSYNRHTIIHRLLGRSRTKSRWLSTASQAMKSDATQIATQSLPPLPVRVALVSSTTAIFTPAFPVVGVVNFGLRYIVWDSSTRHAILGATTLFGAIGLLVQFAANDLLPLAYSYGQLFLPFAVVNGSLAGTAYVVLDTAFGTLKMARMPWAGAAIGGFVGFMGPMSGLYDHAFQWFYDIPEAAGWFSYLLNNAIMLPISTTTGAVIGLIMHPLLYYPIVGIKGLHWAKFSAPLLAGTTAIMVHLYHADYYNTDLFPSDTFLTTDEKRGLWLLPRFHAKNLEIMDWDPDAGYQPLGTGKLARENVKKKLEATQHGDRQTDMVFDSKRKAWLHYVTKGAFGGGDAVDINKIPGERDLGERGLRYIVSDGAVALIMLKSTKQPHSKDGVSTILKTRDELILLANEFSRSSKRDNYLNARRSVDRIEVASTGIALLLMDLLENGNSTKDSQSPKRQRESRQLELNIRKMVPGIMLFTKEESEETQGCSVESQLKKFGWTGIKEKTSKKRIAQEWEAGLNKFLNDERAEATKRQFALAVTGLSVILLYGLVGGTRE